MKREAPAAARNREAIAAVLADELPRTGLVLEIASGTGEHAVFMGGRFPSLAWQPTDPDESARASIDAWRRDEGAKNVREALALNAQAPDWPVKQADAAVCINMVHISAWGAAAGLFRGCAKVLGAAGPLILYGPYREDGVETAASNAAFDQSLRSRNPEWGLRRLADMDRLAADNGFERTMRYAMPANNLMLVYRKVPIQM